MAEFYDIYPKDRWKDPSYRLMDKFSLKGKKGFVTGGGGGIGRNVGGRLGGSRCGRRAGGHSLPRRNAWSRWPRRCPSATASRSSPLYCDVSDKAQVDKPCGRILVRELGTVDIAHINAGVCLMGDDVDVPYETWKKTIDIDLSGAYLDRPGQPSTSCGSTATAAPSS